MNPYPLALLNHLILPRMTCPSSLFERAWIVGACERSLFASSSCQLEFTAAYPPRPIRGIIRKRMRQSRSPQPLQGTVKQASVSGSFLPPEPAVDLVPQPPARGL